MKKTVNEIILPQDRANFITSSIIDDLKYALRNSHIPKHELECYGSHANGLACEDSDIDLYYRKYDTGVVISTLCLAYNLPIVIWKPDICLRDFLFIALKGDEVNEQARKVEMLLRKSALFKDVVFVPARVPIIKLTHARTEKECDISFSEIGTWNSKLMKLFLTFNENLKILTLYVKRLLQRYGLQGTGRITTHNLFWLVVYFMQQRNLLPSVMDVFEAAKVKHYAFGWDCSIPGEFPYQKKSASLYLLLLDFFKFYRDFDFSKYVISPFLGRSIPICDLKNLKFSAGDGVFSNYLRKLTDAKAERFSPHLMNLQHPIIHSSNLAKQVDISIANRFRILCFFAYKRLPDCASVIPVMPLWNYLPTKLPRRGRRPLNLTQFNSLCLNYKKLIVENESFKKHENLYKYVLSVIHQMMETIFGFRIQRIGKLNGGNIGQTNTSLTFFEWQAKPETWEKFNFSHIFRLHNKPENKNLYWQPMCVYIICEICPERKEIKLMVESEVHLSTFLHDHMKKLLVFNVA